MNSLMSRSSPAPFARFFLTYSRISPAGVGVAPTTRGPSAPDASSEPEPEPHAVRVRPRARAPPR
ncbi:hypothetical protein SF12_09235 [Streptomyces sp. MBRL 601]|nr:hypothetical protein SF12_09235 [Streptomyces sp. MBRL 601]